MYKGFALKINNRLEIIKYKIIAYFPILMLRKIKSIPINHTRAKTIIKYRFLLYAYPEYASAIFLELANLEERNKNYLHSSTYLLRIILRLGQDPSNISLRLISNLLNGDMLIMAQKMNEIMRGTDIYPAVSNKEKRLELLPKIVPHNSQSSDYSTLIDTRIMSGGSKRVIVSVVMSVYNDGNRFVTNIKRYLRQTSYLNKVVEFIIVDSSSPGGEYESAKKFLSNNHNILYVRETHRQTLYTSLNNGANLARGEYLCFTTPSDFIVQDGIEYMINIAFRTNADWIQPDCFSSDSYHTIKSAMKQTKTVNCADEYSSEAQLISQAHLTLGSLIKKNVFDKVAGFNGDFIAAGDTDFKLRIASSVKIQHIKKNILHWKNSPSEERLTGHPRAEIEHFVADALNQRKATFENISLLDNKHISEVYISLFKRSLCFKRPEGSSYEMRPLLAYGILKHSEPIDTSEIEVEILILSEYIKCLRRLDTKLLSAIQTNLSEISNSSLRLYIREYKEALSRWEKYIADKGKKVSLNTVTPSFYGRTVWK